LLRNVLIRMRILRIEIGRGGVCIVA